MSRRDAGGYRGKGSKFLSDSGVSIGDHVHVETAQGGMSGVIMPRYESANEDYLIIKLRSGYNVGINISKIKSISKVPDLGTVASSTSRDGMMPPNIEKQARRNLPKVALISTGGTIASKIDYRTGGVHPALTASELYESVPELGDIAEVVPEVVFSEYSENLTPAHWSTIAKRVGEKVLKGDYSGIVISHGTDTMHYTASALSFALRNLPIPVVLVGAQRSSDRPSSDAALNLTAAILFAAKAKQGGIFVAMHQGTSDDVIACHIGTRVRKNHASRRDAFESIDLPPMALVKNGIIEFARSEKEIATQPQQGRFQMFPEFSNGAILLKYFPGFDPQLIDYVVTKGYKVIILEGTGLGHVSRSCFRSLSEAIKSGVLVCMTSQCIWGRVRMTVYDTGRDLLELGVIPLSDMLSETALTKAMWALAHATDVNEVKQIMQNNIAGEISETIPL